MLLLTCQPDRSLFPVQIAVLVHEFIGLLLLLFLFKKDSLGIGNTIGFVKNKLTPFRLDAPLFCVHHGLEESDWVC